LEQTKVHKNTLTPQTNRVLLNGQQTAYKATSERHKTGKILEYHTGEPGDYMIL
jgi:hypothetical protein